MLRTAAALSFGLLFATAAVAGHQDPPEAAGKGARYIVKLKDGARGAAALHAAGAYVALSLPQVQAVAAYIPAQALEGLRRNPSVEYIEEDVLRYPTAQTTPYGIPMVQADLVSDAATGDVTLCIIDSGYSLAHEDLAGNLNVSGTNIAGSGEWSEDTCGHGSHVAGTIAAVANSTGVIGVNPSGTIDLHIIKVFDGADCGWAYASSLINALQECRNAGANVVSMSLGGNFSSSAESTAFQNAANAGVLSIAAAGNGGNTRTSYPAGYASVVSVAAVDEASVKATFSQSNADVEIAAPGVDVLSTLPFPGDRRTVTVGDVQFVGKNFPGAADGTAAGPLVDGGLCNTSADYTGQIVLCQRGTTSFAEKVASVTAGGGLAALIYNNAIGLYSGTLNGTSTIPAFALRQADGLALLALGNVEATVTGQANDASFPYAFYNGTSMATPHAAGVAALVWSTKPSSTAAEVRAALTASAKDLGAAGRDKLYGYGLVQAKAAADRLAGTPTTCTVTQTVETTCTGGVDEDCDGAIDAADADCTAGTCSLGAAGAACTAGDQCCSGNCGGKPGKKTCK